MSADLADSTANLERLLDQIMKETDPVKYDELGSEIWRVLIERERLTSTESHSSPGPFESLEIVMASLKVMESSLLGLKQLLPLVGAGLATEIVHTLIQEADLQIAEIKRRLIS